MWGRVGERTYFHTTTCGLQVASRAQQARLRLQVAVDRPLPRNALVETDFENPLDAAKPLRTSRIANGQEKTLDILSPPIDGARVRSYAVVTRIYSGTDKKNMLGTHRQTCESLFDERDVR